MDRASRRAAGEETADCRLWLKTQPLDGVDGVEAVADSGNPASTASAYFFGALEKMILRPGKRRSTLAAAPANTISFEVRKLVSVVQEVVGVNVVVTHQTEQRRAVALPVDFSQARGLGFVDLEVLADM